MTKPKTVPRVECWNYECTNKVPAYKTGYGGGHRHYCSRLCFERWTPSMKRAAHRAGIPENRAGLRRFIVTEMQRQVMTPGGPRFRNRNDLANQLGVAPATITLWLESLKERGVAGAE